MTKFVHIVYVHPVENGLPNLYKVKYEREFDTKEEAESSVRKHNALEDLMYRGKAETQAVYYGCVNDATGELV
jgi:hypothetical protein